MKHKITDKASQIKAIEEISNLDLTKRWQAIIEEKDPRSVSQNALMYRWNSLVANEIGVSANYVHGKSKQVILLPYLLGIESRYKKAAFIKQILSELSSEKYRILVAFDMIRTSDLSTLEMKEYLDIFLIYWTLNTDVQLKESDLLSEGVT